MLAGKAEEEHEPQRTHQTAKQTLCAASVERTLPRPACGLETRASEPGPARAREGPGCCVTPGGIAWGFSCRVTFPSMVKKIQLHGAGSRLLWGHPAMPLSPLPLAKARFSAETPPSGSSSGEEDVPPRC